MCKKIIYEKKYQQWFQDAGSPDINDTSKEAFSTGHASAEDFLSSLLEKAVFVLLPERVENVPSFVNLGIRIGEECLADTTILEYDDHVSVTYALQKNVPYIGLKELAFMADEASFQNDEDYIYVSFDYYTYATYKSGKRVFPPEIH